MIRAATAGDGEAIARIYNHYVAHTVVTFEEEAVAGAEMARRVSDVQSAGLPWLVIEEDGESAGRVVGYAYAGLWKTRSAYRFTVEISVYLDPAATGRALGTRLYDALFPLLREKKIHAVIGGIALDNPASVALHEKFGMRKVAHFKETGFKFDRWIDVGYWETLL
jgi:L-amino acid N-acyltransferase YncA